MKNENNIVIDTASGDMMKITGVDAIINAANSPLLGGGGAGRTVHRTAGKELLHECRLLGGCRTGRAKTTNAYNMDYRYIVYTVGPVWNDGICGKQEKLFSCYRNLLLLALENEVKRTASPSVFIGIYHSPMELAVKTTTETARRFVAEYSGELEHVLWALFDARTRLVYDTVLRRP